jgi:ligand-binding SRPBCC domain-containing protein
VKKRIILFKKDNRSTFDIPEMKIYTLNKEILLPRPLEEVFAFFADARNLQTITPPWLRFAIKTPGQIQMRPGTRINYRLRVRGIPLAWVSEITVWEPPHRFVDEQRKGPYRLWIHEHRFAEKDGHTSAVDSVRYAVPGGVLIHKLFVERDVKKIFEYRSKKLKELFPAR